MNGAEPRGDLDVVLSMRAQGLLSSSISPLQRIDSSNAANDSTQGAVSPAHSNSPIESSPVSLLSRPHSAGATTHIASASAFTTAETSSITSAPHTHGTSSPTQRPVISASTALKSLFTIGGGRPRSPSTMSYAPPPSPSEDDHPGRPEESFGYAGTSLLGMIRSNSYATDRPLSPTTSMPGTPRVGTPIIPSDGHLHLLERKILPDSDRHLVESETIGEPITVKRGNNNAGMSIHRDFDGRHIVPGRVSLEGVSSPSLQPPPRKRAGTVNGVAFSVSSPEESTSYSYAHANGSTAESLGVNVVVRGLGMLSASPPMPSTPLSQSIRPKDQRSRTSWSSVSTYGSTDQSPSSPDDVKPKRWSRRGSLTHRMSSSYPPHASSPPSPKSPLQAPSIQHPYASESNSLSRSSSIGSGQSRVSELHSRPFSSKRASGSSVQTCSTASTTQGPSGMMFKSTFQSPKPRSMHRVSAPPPQRPAPSSALPPTPSEGGTNSSLAQPAETLTIPRTSFRESLTLRGKRLSSTPPTLPPSSVLPPRPDELGYRITTDGHRRSSSHGNPNEPIAPSNNLRSSPTRGKAPFPPPNTPLPPPPSSASDFSASSSSPRPVSSIKRRFRILSSPPTSPPYSLPSIPLLDIPTTSSFNRYAIPESPIRPAPIGEPIIDTTVQNDLSFLMMSPPTPPKISVVDIDPQGLSPPPRRSSRQVSAPEVEKLMEVEPSVEAVLASDSNEGALSIAAPAPPPEVDDFVSLLTPPVRSSDHSAVSLIDVRI